MITEQRIKVEEAVKAWLAQEGNSQNELNRITDVAPVMLAAMKNGETSYQPNKSKKPDYFLPIEDRYYYKVAHGLNLKFDHQVHFDSDEFREIVRFCKYILARKRRGIIDSIDSGMSKTYTLEWLAKNDPKVLYIKRTSLMNGNDFIEQLSTQLKLTFHRVSKAKKLQLISQKLLEANYLIFIDEMEGAKANDYKVIKDIEDSTKGKCPIILCDMELYKEMKAMADAKKPLMKQTFRRFRGNRLYLNKKFTPETAIKHFQEHGITDEAVLKLLVPIMQDYGMLNEYVSDIYDHIINKGEEVNLWNVKALFELYTEAEKKELEKLSAQKNG